MDMKAVRERLIEHEGLRLDLYQDHLGIWTIGVGRNIQERGISEETAMQMLDEDIEIVIEELDERLPEWQNYPVSVREALVDLAFNMGIPRLLTFKRTLAALNRQEWGIAANELLDSRYAKQVGNRAITISNMIKFCDHNTN